MQARKKADHYARHHPSIAATVIGGTFSLTISQVFAQASVKGARITVAQRRALKHKSKIHKPPGRPSDGERRTTVFLPIHNSKEIL
ncbi:MAG: hypothetical protein V4713_10075 [Pseudomonadota bacterium]